MTPSAPSRLDAKEQEDMEEAAEEDPAEEVEVEEVATEANHSTSILSLSATAAAAACGSIFIHVSLSLDHHTTNDVHGSSCYF